MVTVYILGGLLALLIFAWFYTGGPERADLKGIFLAPPPPVGSGESYGPGEEPGAAPTTESTYIEAETYDPYPNQSPEAI